MAFTALRTWVPGEIVTAAMMNQQVRDNGNEYLQRTGTVPLTANWDAGSYEIRAETLESDVTTGTAPLTIASTTAVTNLNADKVDGQHAVLDIASDHSHQSTGAEGGKIDHGLALDGLTDDDHTQYVLESLLTTQADLPYATGASTWARLPKGTAGQGLRMNAGATAPEWVSPIINLTVADTEVFNGTPPSAFTDLNLSAVVGAKTALVGLKVNDNATNRTVAFRKNGDTDDFYDGQTTQEAGGTQMISPMNTSSHYAVTVATDASGVIEWRANSASGTVVIDVMWFIS